MLEIYDRYGNLDLDSVMFLYLGYKKNRQWKDEIDFMDDLHLFFQCKGAFLALWKHEDIPVSAVRIEPHQDGYLISCLETPPHARRKGYARALLQAVMEYCPGVYYAHVDERNKASLALHKQLGFHILLDYAVYVDGSVHSDSYTLKK